MKKIFVNLKRFDVPKGMGGICLVDDPGKWTEWVMDECVKNGLGALKGIDVTLLLPEALVLKAVSRLSRYPASDTGNLNIGSQGVYREDVIPGGNFGAFTTNLPAAAVKNMGCTWSIIGHSEERKSLFEILERFEPAYKGNSEMKLKADKTVNGIINDEIKCALNRGLNVLCCVGETAEEKGDGSFEEQKPRIEAVLKLQLELGLGGITSAGSSENRIVIGYEPIWAIGPGKTPPGGEYIGFVSAYIKATVKEFFGFDPIVVYGGGLKEENAGMISKIETIGGGLVALTKFIGDIAFEPEGLKRIIDKYIS